MGGEGYPPKSKSKLRSCMPPPKPQMGPEALCFRVVRLSVCVWRSGGGILRPAYRRLLVIFVTLSSPMARLTKYLTTNHNIILSFS